MLSYQSVALRRRVRVTEVCVFITMLCLRFGLMVTLSNTTQQPKRRER